MTPTPSPDIQIKDILHFYLGCQVLIESECYMSEGKKMKIIDTLTSVSTDGSVDCIDYQPPSADIKLLLRPLSDMTDEEAVEIATIHKYDIPDDEGVKEELINIYTLNDDALTLNSYLPAKLYLKGLLWCISKGFDIFNLIPSGQALDKNTQS